MPSARPSPCRRGAFTLLEMAVVLAIIGLLAGAVLAATSYLKSAQQTALINEGKFYLNALKQFEMAYGGALPGDMGDASNYWAGSFNGDGNSMISTVNGSSNNEVFPAFQHLVRAGLIKGTYSGVAGPSGVYGALAGSNSPLLAMEGVTGLFYTPFSGGFTPGTTAFYGGVYGTPFFLTRETGAPTGGFLTPAEAYELDQKFDNGNPSSGWMRAFKNSTNCVSGTDYYLTSPSPEDACALILSQP